MESVGAATTAAMDTVNVGVATVWHNQQQLEAEARALQQQAQRFNKQTAQWLTTFQSFHQSLKALGDVAPAMGMIGTLIGLVQMLSSMDDPKQIGPAMAIALLTTLYGAVIANAFALPVADKLAFRSAEERRNKSLILETISGIQEGLNPRVLETLLKTYLPGNNRGGGGDEAAEAA